MWNEWEREEVGVYDWGDKKKDVAWWMCEGMGRLIRGEGDGVGLVEWV